MIKKRMVSLLGLLVIMMTLVAAPLPVAAATPAIRDIDITVNLLADGSAEITEIWDMTVASGTEVYLIKPNLWPGQEIKDFSLIDETGLEYTNVGEWNSSIPAEDKKGKCGLITKNREYEMCWGISSYGDHVYTLRYTFTNLIMRYDGADAIAQHFTPSEFFAQPQHVKLTFLADGVEFTKENTGVWAFGFTCDYSVQDGKAVYESTKALAKGEYVSTVVEFTPGIFEPAITVNRTFSDLLAEAMQGSSYKPDAEKPSGGGVGSFSKVMIVLQFIFTNVGGIVMMVLVAVGIGRITRSSGAVGSARTKHKFEIGPVKDLPYSRELPFQGNYPATFAALHWGGYTPSESGLIGLFILHWIETRQVDIATDTVGMVFKKEEQTIHLYQPRPEMGGKERSLYNILLAAAGPDYILQSKEFERWSKKNYTQVSAWLAGYRLEGMNELRARGYLASQPAKVLGIFNTTETVATPAGNAAMAAALGFKRYLQDFTIIHEREAVEVHLWKDYLKFAHLFGIAEKVMEQFRNLYPQYFTPDATGAVPGGINMYDVWLATNIARSFSHSAYSGYRSGYNAAQSSSHSSSYSGGGGSYSGGGGSFSGGGGGGGSVGTR